ncbi:MAG: M1 family aminopeptidase [Planctomycetota bacterium]|nr:M1 family aminopeptidase [Planctomycetota bacterium]
MHRHPALLASAVVLSLASPAYAGGDGGCICGSPFHTTPQHPSHDVRSYPPDVPADFRHMRLEVVIEDMNTPAFSARQTLTFVPVGDTLGTLQIDAKALAVESVSAAGYETTFEADGSHLRVTFDPPAPAGQEVTLVTSYRVENPPLGLLWTPESPAWPGRPAQLHTQGQTETNSYWFPCHDYPNDRLTTELVVTVPRDFMVSSNGRLVSHTKAIRTRDRADGSTELLPYETFHWSQEQPHVPYLVSLVVGKFDVVDLARSPVPAKVYAPLGRAADVPATFGRTGAMIEYFAKVLDEPYPWARYDQVVVWNFGWGGMENTSATTLHENVVLTPGSLLDHDQDGLIAHELAHQWFGDLLTCNSWEHIWLNEGITTFMNTLWFEERDGRDAYLARVRETYDTLILNDRPEAPAAQGMASKVYREAWETFSRPANPYGKGASVMHMLRTQLGDEVFFKALATYIDRHRLSTVETSDLRRAFEDVSGETFEQFFAQWVFRPGVPAITVTPAWADGTLTLTVEQTQNIDPDNPAFEFDLPVVVGPAAGADNTSAGVPLSGAVQVRGRTATLTLPAATPPAWIAIDPDLAVLCRVDLRLDEPGAMALLTSGPTLPARIQGARVLGTFAHGSSGSVAGTQALVRVVQSASQPTPLRVECVRALLARRADIDLRSVATSAVDHWEVREATTSALADILSRAGDDADPAMRERILGQLAERAAIDKSLLVRAEAIRGLGKCQALEHENLLVKALETNSQGDLLRNAALDALVSIDSRWALRRAGELAKPGHDSRTRAQAIKAVGTLAKHDVPFALELASSMLGDVEMRSRRAAGEALVAIGDPRGLDVLSARAAAARGPDDRRTAQRWIEDLRTKLGQPAGTP